MVGGTDEKSYECLVCGKRFSKQLSVKQHSRIHTAGQNHICLTCGKRFSKLSMANRHLRVHTGERPYNCSFCGKRFSEQSNLRVHLRIHTSEQPYNCSICGRRFRYQPALVRHLPVHTVQKSNQYGGPPKESKNLYRPFKQWKIATFLGFQHLLLVNKYIFFMLIRHIITNHVAEGNSW